MNIETIKNIYKYKTELHAHTSGISRCSEISAEELSELYSACGADAVVLTNHFTPEDFFGEEPWEFIERYINEFETLKKFGDAKGINILFGMEIRFSENFNDYLVYGLEENDLNLAFECVEKGIDEFYKKFKTEKNLILQAHPFRRGMVLADKKSIDGVEVFNMHPNHNSRVSVAAKYAKENNFIISGGTDFHHFGHEGSCLLRTKFKPETSFEIAEVLKSGDFVFDIGENIIFPYYFK